LRNAVARYLALGEFETSRVSGGDPSAEETAVGSPGGDSVEKLLEMGLPFVQAKNRLIEDFTRRYTSRLLAEHGGDVGKAVQASGIGRRYFQRLRTGR
jgi:hypothetical protein